MIVKDRITFFAPELFINNGVKDISFYENAFGASEQMRLSNDDGSIHVVELLSARGLAPQPAQHK